MDNQSFSPGSTISGIFDTNLKTPDPFQFVYITHPFGASPLTSTTPSDFYETSFEIMELNSRPQPLPRILTRQNSTMNFHCNFTNEFSKCRYPNIDSYYKPREFYDMKSNFYHTPPSTHSPPVHSHEQHFNHHEQQQQQLHHHEIENNILKCQNNPKFNPASKSYMERHILSQENVASKIQPPIQKPPFYNCYDERTVPELKFIFETLRGVWKTPVSLTTNMRENRCRKFCCQNLPHKREGYINCNLRSGANITPNTRSNLVRRYSLPEIEIRKFGVVKELDSILRYCEQLKRNFKSKPIPEKSKKINIIKTVEKSSQTNPVTITEKPITPKPTKSNLVRQPIIEFSDTSPSYLDLVSNRRDVCPKLIKKPETMPETCNSISKINHDSSQLSNSINEKHDSSLNEVERFEENTNNFLLKQSSKEIFINHEENLDVKPVSNIKEVAGTKCLVSKTILSNKKEESQSEDSVTSSIYVAELLIKNLNEETLIADTLMKVLTEQNESQQTTKPHIPVLTPKIEVSTVYVSPEKLNEIISRNSSIAKQESIFKETLQLPDLCLLDTFEKLPPIGVNFNGTTIKNENNLSSYSITEKEEKSSNTISCDSNINKDLGTKNVSQISSITFQDSFDTPTFPKSSEESPIDSLDLEKRSSHHKTTSSNLIDKNSLKQISTKTDIPLKKPSNVAEIQPIKTIRDDLKKSKIYEKPKSGLQSTISSQSEKQIVLPQRKKLSRPKVNDKRVIDSLDQYTIDAKGNPNYQKTSPAIQNQQRRNNQQRCGQNQSSAINSRYLRVSASSTTSRHSTHQNDKLKKVTIFEAQSNIVTPDNDMGPKRFYQKTEIFDGDKKIDILEIVECLQSPFSGVEPKTPGDLYTKFSKIPIPIKKCCRSIHPSSSVAFNSCNGNFKCCSSSNNLFKQQLLMGGVNDNKLKSIKSYGELKCDDDRFLEEYMIHESLDKCENFNMKISSSTRINPFLSKNNELKNEADAGLNNNEEEKINSVEKFKENEVLNPIESSSKSTNINDRISTTNEAYTISIPSTMTVHHGSTPRRITTSKNPFHSFKSSSKSSHASNLLHRRSKKSKNSGRHERRLLSHRKQQHQNEIINVKPIKCNQSIESSRCKRTSAQAGLNCFNDDKLNAWRIPSSDFYNSTKPQIIDNKTIICSDHKFQPKHHHNECSTIKFPLANNTTNSKLIKDKCTPSSKCQSESIISTTTICEKCRLCSCYTSTTFSDRLLYSPTLSVCSVCSQPFTPIYQTPETSDECFNINCNHNTTTAIKKDYNLVDEFGNCKNKTTYLPLTSSQRINDNQCNKGKNCDCSNNRFPKLISTECPPIPEKYCGFMPSSISNICKSNNGNNMNHQPLDRFLTSSSSLASSIWKSTRSHTAMPCINWKTILDNKKKPEIKIEPVKLTTSDDKNSVFTVTVKGPTLEKGTDLKMELCFSNPNKETIKNANNDAMDNETDDVSTCSFETIHERMLPEGPTPKDSRKLKSTLIESGNSNSHLDTEYHLNLSSLLNPRNQSNNTYHNSPCKNNNLSVSGNAIAPEQKPKAPTMTEKDLTGRYRK